MLEVVRDVLPPVEVRQNVKVHRMGKGRGGPPPADVRPLYLVKPRVSAWPVLVIRVHWYTPADYDFVGIAEGETRKAAPATPAKTRASVPGRAMTAEDLLRQFAEAIGAPISKKGTKKRKPK